MGLEITLGLQALDSSLSLSLGSGGFGPNNAHTNAADHIFLKPCGSASGSTRCFFTARRMEIPALLVTQRFHRFKIGSALGGIQTEEEAHCGGE